MPEGVKSIGNNAFENCVNLEEVELPDTLENIGSEAFVNCINLKKIQYGKKVDVDKTAFAGCKSLV